MTNYEPGPMLHGGIYSYQMCAHGGCKKKVRTTALGHDCCGGSRHSQRHFVDTQAEPEVYPPIGQQLGEMFRVWTGTRRRS